MCVVQKYTHRDIYTCIYTYRYNLYIKHKTLLSVEAPWEVNQIPKAVLYYMISTVYGISKIKTYEQILYLRKAMFIKQVSYGYNFDQFGAFLQSLILYVQRPHDNCN